MAHQRENRTSRTRNAFTLAELLVVIVIICLLIGLLMPVLGRAYRTALKSADSALLAQISIGCEAYNQVFHEYPPSAWHSAPVPVAAYADWNVWPPPGAWPTNPSAPGSIMPGWPAPTRLRLVGSAKLYSFLSGFNATWCWDSSNMAGGSWMNANMTTAAPNFAGPCGAYTGRGIVVHINPGDIPSTTAVGDPVTEDKVYGPYYHPDQKGETWATVDWGTDTGNKAQQKVFASRFQRQGAPRQPANGVAETGAPILYYRAAPSPVDRDGNGAIDAWDVYDYRDNFPITNPGNTTMPLLNQTHPLYAPSDGLTIKNTDYDPANFALPTRRYYGISKPFAKDTASSIYWPSAATPPGPVIANNANTFILISPGPDGEYFTDDDVTNYKQ